MVVVSARLPFRRLIHGVAACFCLTRQGVQQSQGALALRWFDRTEPVLASQYRYRGVPAPNAVGGHDLGWRQRLPFRYRRQPKHLQINCGRLAEPAPRHDANRPHSAHGELTPAEFALQWTTTHQLQAA
jgi:hypothetical protein